MSPIEAYRIGLMTPTFTMMHKTSSWYIDSGGMSAISSLFDAYGFSEESDTVSHALGFSNLLHEVPIIGALKSR